MAKARVTLSSIPPTFKARVAIPIPGGSPDPVEFTFKRRNQEAYEEFTHDLKGRDETDVILDIITGWDLEDPFTPENVGKLLTEYIGSARAIFDKYIAENNGAKSGN